MNLERNSSYTETMSPASDHFWLSRLILSSESQDFLKKERDVTLAGLAIALPDIQSMGAYTLREPTALGQDTSVLEIGINLEASSATYAMAKIAGQALRSMEKAGIALEEVRLEEGRLVSGSEFTHDRGPNPRSVDDIYYTLDKEHEQIFEDIQKMTIEYNSSATY